MTGYTDSLKNIQSYDFHWGAINKIYSVLVCFIVILWRFAKRSLSNLSTGLAILMSWPVMRSIDFPSCFPMQCSKHPIYKHSTNLGWLRRLHQTLDELWIGRGELSDLQSQTTDDQNDILSHRPAMYLGIVDGNIQDHACNRITETAIF
jgi:hypothetical protein